MNWFKRKYKKSEWFEGLLWAESLPKDYLRDYITLGRCHPNSFESDRGVADYYLYRQRVLDLVQNK